MKTKITIIITSIALIGVWMFWQRFQKVTEENRELKQNNNWLVEERGYYKTSDSLNAISIQQLNLSIKDFKKIRENDWETIQSLKVDKKRLQSIVSSQTKTINNFKAEVRDSIIYRDSLRVDTVQCMSYNDNWIEFDGCIIDDSLHAEIIGRDSLLYVEHIVPRKFWFIRWGQKERKQEIVSKNPHTEILNAEFITIKD